MKKNLNKKKLGEGFALLYAILLTSAVLIVGVGLINIITQQLIMTSLNRNSQIAYYNARSVVNCLNFYDGLDYFLDYDFFGQVESVKGSVSIQCRSIDDNYITLSRATTDANVFYFEQKTNLANNGSVGLRFAYNLNNLKNASYSGCEVIPTGQTFESSCRKIITVEGSNTLLDSASSRKVERTSLYIR